MAKKMKLTRRRIQQGREPIFFQPALSGCRLGPALESRIAVAELTY
jgi:hypothetical protein